LGLELPHELGGCLNEMSNWDAFEVLLREAASFVLLMDDMLNKVLLGSGELEGELSDSSEFDLVLRKGLGHVVEHPVDFQVVVGVEVVSFCFAHEAVEGLGAVGRIEEVLVCDRDGDLARESWCEPSRKCRMGGGGRVGGVRDDRSGPKK